jgi:hypothetical protein
LAWEGMAAILVYNAAESKRTTALFVKGALVVRGGFRCGASIGQATSLP